MTLQLLAALLLSLGALTMLVGAKLPRSSLMKAALVGGGAMVMLAGLIPVTILLLMLGYRN